MCLGSSQGKEKVGTAVICSGYRVQTPVTQTYPWRALRATRINGLSFLGLDPRAATSDGEE